MIKITFEVEAREFLDPDGMAEAIKRVCTELDYYLNGFGKEFNLGKRLEMKVQEIDNSVKQKVLDTWKHMATHADGKLGKGTMELVLETIRILEGE